MAGGPAYERVGVVQRKRRWAVVVGPPAISNILLHCRAPRKTFVDCILGVRVLDLIKQEANLVLLDAELLNPPSGMGTQRAGRPCLPQKFV